MAGRRWQMSFLLCFIIGVIVTYNYSYMEGFQPMVPYSKEPMVPYSKETIYYGNLTQRSRMNTMDTGQEVSRYLIHTPGCVIPEIDPLHPSLLKYKSKPKNLVCSKKKPLTEESGLFLLLFKERSTEYGVPVNNIDCYYRGIIRVNDDPKKYTKNCDNKWKLKQGSILSNQNTSIIENSVLVNCFDNRKNNSKPVYEAIHFFIQPSIVEKKIKAFKAEFGERQRENLSVVIFGIDSISRGNLQRHMPKTFAYVTKHLQMIDLKGFNKVGDNTDPNLSAILAGLAWKELVANCTSKGILRFDDCPLIWKDFSSKGYATAYGEDAPKMSIFHYNKVGFCEQPTDYYNRPYFYASAKILGITNGKHSSWSNYCQGGRGSLSIIQDYSLSVADALKDIPYFALYWSSSVSHESLPECTRADIPTVQYFKQLKKKGYLENTIVIFISDHGVRFGKFRATYAGVLEERLPYVMFAFPKWFQTKYPEAINTLKMNTRRLTSSFDLHITLHDILNRAYVNPKERSYISALPNHGQSLFLEVPKNRTCADAGIPAHFCTCEHSKPAEPNDKHLKEAAEKAVMELNKGLENFTSCAQLSLKKVLSGRIGTANEETRPKSIETLATNYFVEFVTEPGDAMLESTVRHQAGKYELISEVSRINKYGNQSHCIGDQVFRKYCLCKDILQPEVTVPPDNSTGLIL